MPITSTIPPIVNHLRKPIRCIDRGQTTAETPPANPHAFRLWCAGVPKGQAEGYAEFVKVHHEIEDADTLDWCMQHILAR